MAQVTINLPEEVFSDRGGSPEEFARQMQIAAAIYWYLSYIGIERTPYLAIPEAIYTNYLTRPFFQDSLALHQVNLVTIDLLRQEIVRWNPNPL